MQTPPAQVTDYVGLVSLFVAVASCIASIVAAVYAKLSVSKADDAIAEAARSSGQSLDQAQRVAQREHDEWAQRTWFDLYSKAAEVLDTLDYFRTQYPDAEYKRGTNDRVRDWGAMIFKVRAAGRMAFVFPKNPTVTAFIDACKFRNSEYTVTDKNYQEMFEAVESLRGKALMNPSVLEYDPQRRP
jgi:type II secretory pathway pseudopilin PulG